jgi:hypothetical protein
VRPVLQATPLIIAAGVVQRADGAVNVLVHNLQSPHPRRSYHDL